MTVQSPAPLIEAQKMAAVAASGSVKTGIGREDQRHGIRLQPGEKLRRSMPTAREGAARNRRNDAARRIARFGRTGRSEEHQHAPAPDERIGDQPVRHLYSQRRRRRNLYASVHVSRFPVRRGNDQRTAATDGREPRRHSHAQRRATDRRFQLFEQTDQPNIRHFETLVPEQPVRHPDRLPAPRKRTAGWPTATWCRKPA